MGSSESLILRGSPLTIWTQNKCKKNF